MIGNSFRETFRSALQRVTCGGVLVTIIAAVLATTLLPPRVASAQICNLMQDLGTLGGSWSDALAVSADGQVVVGEARNAANQVRAFRWTATGGMQILGTLGGAISNARCASLDGSRVVGLAYNSGNQSRAFLWTVSGVMQDLGTLGGPNSFANGISANGDVVVGGATNNSRQTCAFRWTTTSGMEDLGTLGGSRTVANAVSAEGRVVVGFAYNAAGLIRAFRWTTSSGMQDLGTLGGDSANARGVSADGSVVVGWARNTAGQTRAFRWTSSGGMEDLGTLGGERSNAACVSADGSVVAGLAYDTFDIRRQFLWTRDDGMQDMDWQGATFREVRGISGDGGVLVGWDYSAEARTQAYRWAGGVLRGIDSRDADNESQHNTNQYVLSADSGADQSRTILRRGTKPSSTLGTADFDVTVAECFDPTESRLSFEAVHTFGGDPTAIDIPMYPFAVPVGQWGCVLQNLEPPSNGERVATMRLFIPSDAAVGEYAFRAVVRGSSGNLLGVKSFDHPVVILFNPWDPRDSVHLATDAERDEYVLKAEGVMWRGTARFNSPKSWAFAQFNENVFLATIGLLDGLSEQERMNPVSVARWLTEKLDANDGGVLIGNWSGDFSGGSPPLDWSGSQAIFTLYRASGPVRYGQCWVYAGLLTSSLRTLGIPTRPVTNFESAHDRSTPPDSLIEACRVVDSSGIVSWEGESVWNFHVWCEAWMKRPDLANRDGWQVVDATPQERSEDLYRLGPTPVSAIKDRTPLPFDGGFVLSEVGADIQLMKNEGGLCMPHGSIDTTSVGRKITTKAVGSNSPVDITETYKTPETTADPREVQELEVVAPAASPLGMPLHADIVIRNTDGQPRDFTYYVAVHAQAQNGSQLGIVVGPHTGMMRIASGGEVILPVDAAWAMIQPWAGSTEFIEFDVMVTRVHDQRDWIKQRVVVIRGIPMTVTLAPADDAWLGRQVTATVTYSNPLSMPLTGAVLTLSSSSGLPINGTDSSEEISLGTIQPGASVTVIRSLTATHVGHHTYSAHLVSDRVLPGSAFESITVIECLADFNNDSFVDFFDYSDYVACFEANSCATGQDADFNNDGFVDFFDYTEFVDAFEVGCS
jgi:probable HAF family extracellular repeat protein